MTTPSPDDPVVRGPRDVAYLDFASAPWETNQYGVDVLLLSSDALSGAVTLALRMPAGLDYPERAHFYDCDQDLFQFEGEFHHDEELKFYEGDYVYRPPGTVYGNSIGSSGGLIVASLNRRPVRFHFDEHPEPWTGEYLVDRRWAKRDVAPFVVRERDISWQPSEGADGIEIKPFRGMPGQTAPAYGARAHSPWGADAAFLMRLRAGALSELPHWPQTTLEVLALSGEAEIAGRSWHRGVYSFGQFSGPAEVTRDLVFYARAFADQA